MKKIYLIFALLIFIVVSESYALGANAGHANIKIKIRGYSINGEDIIFMSDVLSKNGIYFMNVWGSAKDITSTLTVLDDNMHLLPLASYRLNLSNYYSYSNFITKYGDGFLIAGTLTPKRNSEFMGGFWISFIDKNFNVVWTKVYLTRFSSSISKVIYDNNTGKLLLIGEGCFYSGDDGFFAVFNPKTLRIEKIIGIGGIAADGISDVLIPDNRTYILVGSSWSFKGVQERIFLIKLNRDFDIISSRAYTILENGSPVERLVLHNFNVIYHDGRISIGGVFRVDHFTPQRTTLVKAGIWWMEFDDDLNLLTYRFKTTTFNSSPIELGSIEGLFKMKELDGINETVLVADVSLKYPMVMVGKLNKNKIVGELIGVPYPAGAYLYLTYPYTVVFKKNSLIIFLKGKMFSERDFQVYNRSTIVIDIPYYRLSNIDALKSNYLYGGSITIKLHPWNISIQKVSNPFSSGLKIINVSLKPVNAELLRIDTVPFIVTLHNPRPVGYLDVVINESSYLFLMSPQLYLDGMKIKPNRKYPLPAGTHTLTVKKQGFRPYSTKIQISPNSLSYLFFNNWIGFLNMSIEPSDANFTMVCFSGLSKNLSYTLSHTNGSVRMILPVGWCNITIQKEGYNTYSKKILIPWGGEIRKTVVLIPKPAHLFINSKPKAKIFINGSVVGETPKNVSLFYGRYQVTLSAPGYRSYSINVTLAPGSYQLLNVTLVPLYKTNETTNQHVHEVIKNTTSTVVNISTWNRSSGSHAENNSSICGPAFIILLSVIIIGTINKKQI